ncbi:uncharacterized protein [Asterias amurensis]|uniref:uncharacterized protein n=1 Tax=Asterias amurensis TaxID=7602 RepID=UPI003AB530A0
MSSKQSSLAASDQFTISRASLPSLLEWTDRLQERFKVKIDIQWELEGTFQQDAPQVRWVYLYSNNLEDSHAAKTYIITLCDPLHKLNVTYPEDIHDTLKSSQAKLEGKYSVVIQFTKTGQLIIKSQDQMNMMLVLSYIESCASELERTSFMETPRRSPRTSSAASRRREIKEQLPYVEDLETDSIITTADEAEEAPSAADRSTLIDSKHQLKRRPRCGKTNNTLLAPQDFVFSSSAISPDRKMIKSSQLGDLSPNSILDNLCTFYDLNARQKQVVQRILQRGEYTKAEVERTLERKQNDWKCSDFPELIRAERDRRKVPQTSSRNDPSGDRLVDLKETQGSLMQSLESPPHSPQCSKTAAFLPKRFSSPLTTGPLKDYISGSDISESFITISDSDGTVVESDDPITILSLSEPEYIVVNSSEESDTPETFYVPTPPSRRKSSSGEKELHGVVEGLRQQLKELQDKLEKDKQEQQQQFQEKLLEQEIKIKAEQGVQIQKQIQEQQQLKKKETTPKAPLNQSLTEDLVIAPAKRNKDSPLRPVVIDGSNVAMCHGRDRIFSCRGIAICVHYFQQLGHQDIMVFVPLGRRTQHPDSRDRPIRDQPILDQLKKQGLLSYTPSRRIGHSYVNCYDDKFIVELAVENGGVIVSNDNYRDLMRESSRWKSVIENRLVMFTFAGDRFMIPDDPLGRNGPHIRELLRKTPKSKATTSRTQRVTQVAPAMQQLRPATRAVAPATASSHNNKQLVPRAAPHWRARSTAAAGNLLPQGPAVVHPVKVSPQKPQKSTPKKLLEPTVDNDAPFDPKLSPFFKTLQPVFPDNEAEVLKVLTGFRDMTELNDLSLLVLAEIRDGSAQT